MNRGISTHAILPTSLRRERVQTGGSNALNNSCRIHYISPVELHALKRSSRICWQLSIMLFDHTSASSPPSFTTSAKLHADYCKTNLKASLHFISLFPLMSAHVMPVWPFLASKLFLKLKTWREPRSCCTTPLLRPGFQPWHEKNQIMGTSLFLHKNRHPNRTKVS